MQSTTRPRLVTRSVLTLVAASLVLAACGDGVIDPIASDPPTTPESSSPSETSWPMTIEADNGPVTIEAMPTSIVSISPTSTEILFAIGAGEQVVAVDEYSDFPEGTPITDLSGFQPNVEAILGFDPDLVIMSYDPGEVVAALETAGVPAIVHDAATTLDDSYRQIEQLGAITGHIDEAAGVVADMTTDLEALVASLPQEAAGLRYYHELDSAYFTATSSTFIGELYGLFGLENIADAADPEGTSFGFPQLSAEYIVDANPDLIFLADTKCCDVTAESVAERDGWSSIAAVRTGSVVELDDDLASRWGPRVVDYLELIADAIRELVAA